MKDELAFLSERIRSAASQRFAPNRIQMIQWANELDVLIARAEDPPCTRCGQKINGPAPRGICGDCTAEDQEQAARDWLCCVRCGGYVERSYATGDCYAPDCEPQHMSSHDEAQPYAGVHGDAELDAARAVWRSPCPPGELVTRILDTFARLIAANKACKCVACQAWLAEGKEPT